MRRASKFPTWKTVKLGTHRTVELLLSEPYGSPVGFRVTEPAEEILGKIALSPSKSDSGRSREGHGRTTRFHGFQGVSHHIRHLHSRYWSWLASLSG